MLTAGVTASLITASLVGAALATDFSLPAEDPDTSIAVSEQLSEPLLEEPWEAENVDDFADRAELPITEETADANSSELLTGSEPEAVLPAEAQGAGELPEETGELDVEQVTSDASAETPRPQQRAVAPVPGRAVINVRIGGDRQNMNTTLTGVGATGVQGVQLRLAPNDTALSTWASYSWANCTSDANGDCTFEVPIRSGSVSSTGMPTSQRPYVHQVSAPSGWSLVQPTLGLSESGTNTSNYVFQLKENVLAGNVYNSTASTNFMRGSDTNMTGPNGADLRTTSHGKWMVVRDNPALSQKCGLDIALVADLSNSVGSDGLPKLKSAMNSLVDGLRGTPSRVALFNFSTHSPAAGGANQNYPQLSDVTTSSQAQTVKNRYANWTTDKITNWDEALWRVADAQTSYNYDLVVFITDGLPTWHSTANPNYDRYDGLGNLRSLEAGVFSANLLKSRGARVVPFFVNAAIGQGSVKTSQHGYVKNNLRALSGPTENSDFYWSDSYDQAAKQLSALAKGNCDGSVKVTKRVVTPEYSVTSATTSAQLNSNSALGSGWRFTASSLASSQVTIPSGAVQTTGSTGTITVPVKFPDPHMSGRVRVAETQMDDHSLVQVAGQNAVCVNTATGQSAPVTNYSNTGFDVTAHSAESIECTVYNQAPPTPLATGALAITKAFDGSVPAGSGTNTTFSGGYNCYQGGVEVAAGKWSRVGTGAATLVRSSGPEPTALPVGVICAATENTPSGGLPEGWSWATPSVGGMVTITAGQSNNITVTNKAQQSTGALTITKAFDDSVPAGSGTNTTFSGDYSCRIWDGRQWARIAEGTWSRVGTGAATLVSSAGPQPTNLPVGAECEATEKTPSGGLPPGWSWATPSLGGKVTITAGTTKNITVTNKAQQLYGSVQWEKVDESDEHLAGSVWELTGPDAGGTAVEVTDCVSSPCQGPDTDARAGYFKIEELALGDYTLVETKAPAGYQLDPTERPFTVGTDAPAELDWDLEKIENQVRTGPAMPLTGGIGADMFLIGGALTIGTMVAIGGVRRYKIGAR